MLYEKLTALDKDTFRSYVQEFAPKERSEIYKNMAPNEVVLRWWDEAKNEYLYDLFGEKFILEKEIEYEQSRSFIWKNMHTSLSYGDMSRFKCVCQDRLIEEFSFTDDYYTIIKLFDIDNLVDNVACTLWKKYEITFKNGSVLKLDPNAKTMKLLGRLAKILDIEKEFETFRLKHSLVLNQKRLKGTLCLSIHPMDYITMSDNRNGWSSCMSWEHDGDYRMGTVEMMNSPCVIVAYLKSDKETFTWGGGYREHEKWNSKLWRSLFIVDRHVIMSVKNYPYDNVELTSECLEWLRQLAQDNCNWNFPHPIQVIPENETFDFQDREIRITCETNKMYNDFGNTTSRGIISDTIGNTTNIFYSGRTTCMFCGGNADYYDDASCVLCSDCADDGNYYYCDCCGERIYCDDVYYVGDEVLCSYCFDNQAGRCEITDDYYFNEELVNVYLARKDNEPDVENDYFIRVCEDYAYSERNYEKSHWLSSYITHAPREKDRVYYWNLSDLDDRGLRTYFGLSSSNREKYASGD